MLQLEETSRAEAKRAPTNSYLLLRSDELKSFLPLSLMTE